MNDLFQIHNLLLVILLYILFTCSNITNNKLFVTGGEVLISITHIFSLNVVLGTQEMLKLRKIFGY